MTEEVRDWWEAIAEYFQDEIDMDVGINWTGQWAPDVDLFTDAELDGAQVLELGCGGGQCTVAIAQRGATVTGIDLSAAQLAHARELAAEHGVGVEFLRADVTDLGMFADESFDVAFNAWVFQWVGDLAACFTETCRVLRPGGRFVFSMPHPYYDLLDPDSGAVADSYFDTGRQVISHDGMEVDHVTYRHSVSDVHNALRAAGFEIDRLLEPGTDDPDAYGSGPWGEHVPALLSKIPSVLIVDARKPGAYTGRRKP